MAGNRKQIQLDGKTLVSVSMAAEMLFICRNTLRRWSDLGEIPTYKIGRRKMGDRYFDVEDIQKILDSWIASKR